MFVLYVAVKNAWVEQTKDEREDVVLDAAKAVGVETSLKIVGPDGTRIRYKGDLSFCPPFKRRAWNGVRVV